MVKVAVNRCYGGFGLSPKASKRYLELNGKECHFYTHIKFKHSDGKEEYKKLTLEEVQDTGLFFSITLKDLGDKIEKIPNDFYQYESFYDKKRADKILIQVIEELGDDANGQCANIEIVEVPEDVEWEIDEYDGKESIHETHRSWQVL